MRIEQGENWTLYHADCLAVLPTLTAGSVDAVIADPPYGTTACAWDSVIPFEPMWKGIKHVLKPRGAAVLFGSQPFTSALVMSNAAWFKYEVIWGKDKPTGHLDALRKPLKAHENIVLFSENGHTYNPQMAAGKRHKRGSLQTGPAKVYGNFSKRVVTESDLFYPKSVISYPTQKNAIHPTQKPVALMEYLIKTYTNPGDTVLDFTMGSGSTGVAALRTGRRFIGIELDPDYFDIALTRIKNAAGEFVRTEKERATGQLALWEAGT